MVGNARRLTPIPPGESNLLRLPVHDVALREGQLLTATTLRYAVQQDSLAKWCHY